MAFPIVTPFLHPQPLSGRLNGLLPNNVLVEVGPSGRLEVTTARCWRALVADAAEEGFALTWTYGGCYRSLQEQEQLFLRRYTPDYLAGRNTYVSQRTWNGARWFKLLGVAAVATPGTSNHGWGLAVDVALDNDPSDGVGPNDAVSITPALPWLVANAPLYGFSWESQAEPWHIRYVAGDAIPAAALNFEAVVVALPYTQPVQPSWTQPVVEEAVVVDEVVVKIPPYDAAGGMFSLWTVVAKPICGVGVNDVGEHVKYLQDVLRYWCGQHHVTVDGKFGEQTRAAVVAVQRFCGLTADGWVGPKTWVVIDKVATDAKPR